MNGTNRRTLAVAALLPCILLASSCKRPPEPQGQTAAAVPALKPAPPTPVEEKREQIGGPTWDPAWDRLVELALPPEFLSPQAGHAVRSLCPRFDAVPEADKRAFWAYFFQALAAAEAGLKPTTNVRHTEPAVAVKDKVTGAPVRSEGLLQLTYQDSERYGCDFNYQADRALKPTDPARTILQPKNNLQCGIKILDQQLFTRHKPLLSSSSYWSTLRPGTVSYRVWAKQMANVPDACGLHGAPPTGRRAHASRSAR